MPRIVVVTHAFDMFLKQEEITTPLSSAYLLFDILQAMRPLGYSWRVSAGLEPPRGDVAILHVNTTHTPPDYAALAARFEVALNFGSVDISKRTVTRALLAPGDAWTGPVIVKTDLNYGGKPEAAINARAAARGLAEPFPGVVADDHYPVYDRLADVPDEAWTDPSRIVQRFLPEIDPAGFAMRTWVFAGTRERCTRHVSEDRIVKAARMVSRSPAEVPDALRHERERLGFDYGKFDFVVHDGEPILLDANRTPGTATAIRQYARDGSRNLAEGMHEAIEGRRRMSS